MTDWSKQRGSKALMPVKYPDSLAGDNQAKPSWVKSEHVLSSKCITYNNLKISVSNEFPQAVEMQGEAQPFSTPAIVLHGFHMYPELLSRAMRSRWST